MTLIAALELTELAEKLACRYLPFPTVSVERRRGEVKVRSDRETQKKEVRDWLSDGERRNKCGA